MDQRGIQARPTANGVRFVARWYEDGKERSRSFATRPEAVRFQRERRLARAEALIASATASLPEPDLHELLQRRYRQAVRPLAARIRDPQPGVTASAEPDPDLPTLLASLGLEPLKPGAVTYLNAPYEALSAAGRPSPATAPKWAAFERRMETLVTATGKSPPDAGEVLVAAIEASRAWTAWKRAERGLLERDDDG